MWPYAPMNEFSEDGRLKQVEYATRATQLSNTIIGVVGKNCVVIASLKKEESRLLVSSSNSPIHRIDDGVAAAFAGLPGDARTLASRAQEEAVRRRFELGEPPSLLMISRVLEARMQEATMLAGTRPFGVVILLGGYTGKLELIRIDASAGSSGIKAGAAGKKADEVTSFLEQNYNEDTLTDETETVKLALRALRTVDTLTAEDITVAVLTGSGSSGNYKSLSTAELKTVIESIS
ncbi:hypothetical protein FO519_000887 [Halicephalobus sp. NKZ332]|nr:hypothetical protein FO519_000887 [Halicephalobus sp. NKZ332]